MTGGASAAYGADALAGVTNFILNRDFRGVSLSLDAGTTDFSDGDTSRFSLAGGFDVSAIAGRSSARSRARPSIKSSAIPTRSAIGSGAGAGCRTRHGAPRITSAAAPRNLKLPDVHSTVHTPAGKIAGGFNQTNPNTVLPVPLHAEGQIVHD